MAGERITGAITAAEAQKDNVQYLDAVIPLLSRRLLYESPAREEEIAGYCYLRRLTTHTDETVRDAARSALERRWRRIGFYELHTPSKRFPSFGENDRAYFHEAGWTHSGSGVGDDSKVAILELARRREPMTTRQLEDVMTPLIGLQKNFPQLVDELKKLHVLTEELKYVPVAESLQARVRMTDAAYGVLAPHLPVLEAISYPEQRIAEEDKQLALAVGREVDKTLTKAVAFWTEDNIQGLTMPQQRHFGILASIGMLDFKLKEERRGSQRRERQADVISFVAEQGRLYKLSHADNSLSDYTREFVEVGLYPYRRDQNQLLIDFWGQQVRSDYGRGFGQLGVYKGSRGANYVEVSGVLTSVLPEGLQGVSSARVSAEGMTVFWKDVSERGREIDLEVYFQKSQEEPTPRRSGRGETYVTSEPTQITVPASSESKRPRRRKKTGEDDEGLDFSFRVLRTTHKEIALDKGADAVEVMHPKGRYTVAYQKTEAGVEITFTGRGWENKVVVPSQLNPVEVVRSMGQQIEGIEQRVSSEREAIQQQVASIKHMGLVEHTYYSDNGRLPTGSVDEFFEDKEYYQRLVSIDQGLAALDPDTQYYAKYYMAVLGEMRRSRPIQEKTAREMDHEIEDPRVEFRKLIRKYDINIPEELLVLSEEVFMPEEYRNPPNEEHPLP